MDDLRKLSLKNEDMNFQKNILEEESGTEKSSKRNYEGATNYPKYFLKERDFTSDDNDSSNETLQSQLKEENDDDDDDDDDDDEPRLKRLHLDTTTEIGMFDLVDLDLDLDEEEDLDESQSDFSSSSIDDEEIDKMLEEGIQATPSTSNLIQEKKPKVLLKALGKDHFELLPEGWVEVPHNSGMPVYLHKASRVCTMSKPYYLGPASTRKHEIPVSAIPCLNYRRELDKLEKKKLAHNKEQEENNSQEQNTSKSSSEKKGPQGSNITIPCAKIESLKESKKQNSLDCIAVRDYCKNLFQFETITVRRFASWAGRRRHHNVMKQIHRPTLPEGTKLITIPVEISMDKGPGSVSIRREFVMNPSGKSYVCILHEYVQHALRTQPKFVFKELENAATPFMSTVVIGDTEYGSGYGSSKKQAKTEAARATIETLIPEMKDINLDPKKPPPPRTNEEIDFFDQIQIEDVRVTELCTRAGHPTPYQILLECLKRNHGMGNTNVKYEMKNLNYQKNEFSMTVGKHSAKVICKNKREGKQRASQAILKAIHPYISCWGSLLQLYGKGSCKTVREKKDMEHSITFLQSKARHNQPNYAILSKLHDEMRKLRQKREEEEKIKGKPTRMELLLPSTSNLKNVEL